MTAQEAYILAKAYTKKSIEGAGSLKGAACQIKSIEAITGGHRITFEWEDNDGEVSTDTMDVMDGADGFDGVGISSITYKETDAHGNYVYTVTLTDTNTYDIICPKGAQGETGATGATGNGIASIEKTSTAGLVDTYTITYTNGQTTTFTVTNGESITVDSAMSGSSTNPVQNKVITEALADKQDAEDNNLTTEAKTIVGAINEHEGEISSLKSGLTNANNNITKVNVALAVPENTGKNILPLTLDILKAKNTSGTWADNVYTHNDVAFTVNTDSDGNVTSITANGTASADATFYYAKGVTNTYNGCKINGCTGGSSSTNYLAVSLNASPWTTNTNYSGDTNITIANGVGIEVYTRIKSGYEASDVAFYPMIRPATVTDSTFAPYIPSVESRIEAVESGMTNIANQIVGVKAGYLSSSSGNIVYIPAKVYPRVLIALNTQGASGADGRPTIVGVLSMGVSGTYRFEQITNVTDYALTFTYDNATDPDNPRFAVQYIKVSDSTPQTYLRGFYLTADLRWA